MIIDVCRVKEDVIGKLKMFSVDILYEANKEGYPLDKVFVHFNKKGLTSLLLHPQLYQTDRVYFEDLLGFNYKIYDDKIDEGVVSVYYKDIKLKSNLKLEL